MFLPTIAGSDMLRNHYNVKDNMNAEWSLSSVEKQLCPSVTSLPSRASIVLCSHFMHLDCYRDLYCFRFFYKRISQRHYRQAVRPVEASGLAINLHNCWASFPARQIAQLMATQSFSQTAYTSPVCRQWKCRSGSGDETMRMRQAPPCAVGTLSFEPWQVPQLVRKTSNAERHTCELRKGS